MKHIVMFMIALTLGACQRADKLICKPLYDPSSWIKVPDELKKDAIAANECVRRTAYRLGVADGPPSDIALAAVEACSDDVELYVLMSAEAGLLANQNVDSVIENQREYFAKLARSYTIQTRAGACDKLRAD